MAIVVEEKFLVTGIKSSNKLVFESKFFPAVGNTGGIRCWESCERIYMSNFR